MDSGNDEEDLYEDEQEQESSSETQQSDDTLRFDRDKWDSFLAKPPSNLAPYLQGNYLCEKLSLIFYRES